MNTGMLLHDLEGMDPSLPVYIHTPSVAWYTDGVLVRATVIKDMCVIYVGSAPTEHGFRDERPTITVADAIKACEHASPTIFYPTFQSVAYASCYDKNEPFLNGYGVNPANNETILAGEAQCQSVKPRSSDSIAETSK